MENSFLMERVNKCRQQVEDLDEQIAAVQKQHMLLVLTKEPKRKAHFYSDSYSEAHLPGFSKDVPSLRCWFHFRSSQERLEEDLERDGRSSDEDKSFLDLNLRTSDEHPEYRLSADECE